MVYLICFERINPVRQKGCKKEENQKEAKNMKKTVCKKEYDTETMTVVKKVAHGVYGDPAGYEEILYVAADGKYFLYGVGGETSPYPAEKLVSLAKAKAAAWEKENA